MKTMTVSDRISSREEPPESAHFEPAQEWRRRELGLFLRSRRRRLAPPEADNPAPQRRRTKGLRREEVAEMLGVSPSWYTKLEQGRDVSPSPRLLARIAEVLHLSAIEREQLLRLGMEEPVPASAIDEAALHHAQMIIDAMPYSPAYVLTSRADYVACNRAARELFGNYERFAGNGNQLISLFMDKKARHYLPAWQESARSQVAMFRTAFARYVHDRRLQELVLTLLKQSPEFRQLWEEYELPAHSSRRLRYRPPEGQALNGRSLDFNHFTFFADLEKQLRVEVFNPANPETQRQIAGLVS